MVAQRSYQNPHLAANKDSNFEEEFQNAMTQFQMNKKKQMRQVLAQGVQERQNLHNKGVNFINIEIRI